MFPHLAVAVAVAIWHLAVIRGANAAIVSQKIRQQDGLNQGDRLLSCKEQVFHLTV